MVKKLQKLSADKATGSHLGSTVKDSAQQIWLAGLGAFSKAQEEGGKVFEALVKEGLTLQRKTQSAAEEKISEATSKMSDMANEIGAKASGQWDKLESIFEDRVAKVLKKLGVPAAADVEGLLRRIDELNAIVAKLSDKTAEGAKAVVKSVAKAVTPADMQASAKPAAAVKTARKVLARASAKTSAKTAAKAPVSAPAKAAAKAPARTPRKTTAAKLA
ncbi:MAG: phasin family protein [Burkholderiaceae bacterium]